MDARQLKDKAQEAFSKGKWAKAAELYAGVIQKEPKDHQARLRMGDAYAKASQREKAIAAYVGAAEAFARDGFLPRAIAASKLVLELDPKHTSVQQMLADLYARRGTPTEKSAGGLRPAPAPSIAGPARPAANDPTAVIVTPAPVDAPAAGPRVIELDAKAGVGSATWNDELPAELQLPQPAVDASPAHVIEIEVEADGAPITGMEIDLETSSGSDVALDVSPSAGTEVELEIEYESTAEAHPGVQIEIDPGVSSGVDLDIDPSAVSGVNIDVGPPAASSVDLEIELVPSAGTSEQAASSDVGTNVAANALLSADEPLVDPDHDERIASAHEIPGRVKTTPAAKSAPPAIASAPKVLVDPSLYDVEPANTGTPSSASPVVASSSAATTVASPSAAATVASPSASPVVAPSSASPVVASPSASPVVASPSAAATIASPSAAAVAPPIASAASPSAASAIAPPSSSAIAPPSATAAVAPPSTSASTPVSPSATSAPPGMQKRKSPEVRPSGRIFVPGASAPAAKNVPAAPGSIAAAPKGPGSDLSAGLQAFSRFEELELDALDITMRLSSAAIEPPSTSRPAHVPSFAELEMEGSSLLHAVEVAAVVGLNQRAHETGGAEDVLELPDGEEAVTGIEVEAEALPKIPLFSDLPADAFIALFERCPLRRFGPGERIIAQGSVGDAFYVICEGSVRVVREDLGESRNLATLEEGSFFGEMALLSGAARTASVDSASDDTQLLEISAPILTELSLKHPTVAQALRKFCRQRMLSNLMQSSALFKPFDRANRKQLVERFRAREVPKDAIVIRDGERADGLYVVLSGELAVTKGDQTLAHLKEGDLFGEMSLLQKTPASATVSTTRRTSLLRLPREDFDALILSHPQILILVAELTDDRRRQNEAVLSGAARIDEEGLMLV